MNAKTARTVSTYMPLEVIWREDINLDNASRYDLFRASPPKHDLLVMWTVWAIIAFISATACAIVIVSILCNRPARGSSFNLYVLFVTTPDFVFSFLCGITCARNAALGEYSDDWMCEFQSWYCIFGFTASPWLNACIAHELHKFLKATKALQSYHPPARSSVMAQACCVYAWAAFLASWTLWGVLPHRANAAAGLACLPIEYAREATLFFWLCFVPLFIGLPLGYILYVAAHTSWHRLIDPRRSSQSREARVLAIYFARIFVVFLIMWGRAAALRGPCGRSWDATPPREPAWCLPRAWPRRRAAVHEPRRGCLQGAAAAARTLAVASVARLGTRRRWPLPTPHRPLHPAHLRDRRARRVARVVRRQLEPPAGPGGGGAHAHQEGRRARRRCHPLLRPRAARLRGGRATTRQAAHHGRNGGRRRGQHARRRGARRCRRRRGEPIRGTICSG